MKGQETQESINQEVFLWQSCPLLGGKGGFGALLRSIGRDPSKTTTNYDACRDLNGRRIRHVKNEQSLQGWLDQEQQRQQERQKVKDEKEQDKKVEREAELQVIQDKVQNRQNESQQKAQNAIAQGLKLQNKSQVSSKAQGQDKLQKRKLSNYMEQQYNSESDSDNETQQNIKDMHIKKAKPPQIQLQQKHQQSKTTCGELGQSTSQNIVQKNALLKDVFGKAPLQQQKTVLSIHKNTCGKLNFDSQPQLASSNSEDSE